MAAKTEFGVNGQIVRKLSTDSIAVGLMVPSEGRSVFTGIQMLSPGIVTLSYLDANNAPQTVSFLETEIPTERTVSFFWSDDDTATEAEVTPVKTGYSPQEVDIPVWATARAYFFLWVSGTADGVVGRGIGPIQLTAFGEGGDLFVGPTPLTVGGVAGNLWRIYGAQTTNILTGNKFKITW